MNIDIKQYLTESQKKEIAEDEYRRIIREELKTDSFGFTTLSKRDRLSNAQRLMSNAIHYILENECEEILDKSIDLKRHIKKNVNKTILNKKDYSYSIFREKGTFQKEDSLGQQILDAAIKENEDLIKKRVEESIENFFKKDPDYLNDWMNEAIGQVLLEKLKQ